MAETILDKISKHPNNTYITDAWLTGQTGEIVDLKGDCVFRFIDYDTEGELRIKHTTEESQLSCPIVACGFVGYWLHKKDSEGTKAIFDGYYELCLKNYEKAHECDDDAWERDLKKEFVCRHHVPTEKKWIKASEALFLYITESDQRKVKSIMANYLKYARSKRKQLYPPNHPANRIIEDTFLDAYRIGGAAYECMSWMRTEYNLPYMWPHWRNDNKTAKELLSGIWKEHHDKVIPEYIAEEYEDFDDRVLKYTNGGLMEEIDENLKNCQTQEDRIRYIISLLQPFKEFADAFDAKARIDERKRSIKEHEKWIKNWEGMPEDAVDERTCKPIRPKDQIAACVESIEEYKQDIEYWEKVQQDFYWFAQHGLGAGDYRDYPQEVNDNMCKYLGGWWDCMIFFARRLAALALTYGIKLMDVQERCEIYLMWHFMITDYVDEKHITSTEHARKLLDEIDAKKPQNKPNSKVESPEKAERNEADSINLKKVDVPIKKYSDFEHLKSWQDNPDLDYYLSENHWNFHVNTLLYKNLLVFHEGKEVGAFLNPTCDSFSQPIKDYTRQYGEMFNEAYRLCRIVLTSSVPETKVAQLAAEAAKVGIKRLFGQSKDQYGNPVPIDNLTPNVTDLIESYHILGMVNAILILANDHKAAVDRFLIALSVYKDNGMYFCGYTHCFEPYNETYQGLIAATIIDGSNLRPGYDNKSRDEYLRRNIPWYKNFANVLEKRMQESEDEGAPSMVQQHNVNSNVFNNCQVTINNTQASLQPQNQQHEIGSQNTKGRKKNSKGGNKGKSGKEAKPTGFPKTLAYYTFNIEDDEKKARKERVEAVFRLWTKWEWIDKDIIADDFHSFFKGHDRFCNIKWTTNAAILTLLLQTLILRKDVIAEQTGCHPNSLVINQFGFKKADYRDVDEVNKKRIDFTIFVLDVNHSFQEIYKEAKNKMSETDNAVMKEFADDEIKRAMEEEAKTGNARIRKNTWGLS